MISFTLLDVIQLVVPIVIIEGIFSGSEIAILSVDRVTLKKLIQSGKLPFWERKGIELALRLLENSDKLLATTLLITSICVVSITGIITIFLYDRGGDLTGILTVLLSSSIVVIFGEFIPKAVYQRHALALAPWVSYAVWAGYYLFYPITRLLNLYTSLLGRIVGSLEVIVSGRKRTTRDELRKLISYGGRDSEIRISEKKMIRRLLDFKDSDAKHALIPLVEVDAISDSATVREALEAFQANRHSRTPIYSERVDNIVGVLEINDLLIENRLDDSIKSYIQPAHYASETQNLYDVLDNMKQEQAEMTIVVDEHGGAVGILTFEDIIEEIVGEIYDEYDSEEFQYRTLSEGEWDVQARMEIEDINERLKIELPEGDYETLSGFLLHQFGRIPRSKDELFFDTSAGSFRFLIRKATDKRIDQVTIERLSEREKSI